jgi:polysaccharide biosynthesis transport protein
MTDTVDFSVLLRRKWRIVVSGLVAACLALVASRMLPRQYTSVGGMIVENSEPTVPGLGIGIGTGAANNDGVVLTQLEVLNSRGLIQRVVHDLNLAAATDLVPAMRLPVPIADILEVVGRYVAVARAYLNGPNTGDQDLSQEDRTIEYVQKHLKTKATEHSSVISISFQGGSPRIASAVVNAVMKAYMATDIARRQVQTSQVNQWLMDRTATLQNEADEAEKQVEAFVRNHNLPEVQGSSTAAIQLSKDQDQLAIARQALATKLATLDNVQRGGGAGAEATLESRTIQAYKDREAQIVQQIASLSPLDPRRGSLEHALAGIQSQIGKETERIVDAMKRAVDVARTNVAEMKAAVDADLAASQMSSVDASILAKLKHDAEAKRQLYIAFGTRSEQTQLAAAELPSARILFQAAPEPVHSFAGLALLFGFAGGVLLSVALIILRESMGTRINTTTKMALATGLPGFGSLPEVKAPPRLISAPDTSLIAETLRGIWIRLRHQSKLGEGTTVIVTSSEVGEGKTTVAAALAHRIAADGYRVLLIDGDLRRHRVGATLGLRPEASLESVLNGSRTLGEAVLIDPTSGIHCLLADGSTMNPMMVLASDAFEALLTESKMAYDFVVLDSPPVLRVADPVIMAKLCQHVLFIVRADTLGGKLVGEALQRFSERDRSKILTLLTRVRPGDLHKGDYFGGY